TVDRDRRALEHHLAGVERVDPCDALDQGALSGAVVPPQGGNFGRTNVKIHIPEDVDGTETLIDPPQGQQLALLSLGSGCHPLTPCSSQAFLSASEVQILSAVVNPSATTSLTFSGKIACGWSSALLCSCFVAVYLH